MPYSKHKHQSIWYFWLEVGLPE